MVSEGGEGLSSGMMQQRRNTMEQRMDKMQMMMGRLLVYFPLRYRESGHHPADSIFGRQSNE
jgi:hypothetical protein